MQKVVHFEIPADNEDRAQTFYEKVFGWNIFKPHIPGWDYRLASTTETNEKGMPSMPGAINGAIMKRAAPGGTPVIVINVPSVEEAVQQVEAAGGTLVMPPRPAGGMGIFAKFKDTEGNVLGIWQDLKPE